MRRREFIALVGSLPAVWPLTVRAQQPQRMRRVSVLLGVPENDPETKSRLRAFRLGMRDAGWVEGRNVQIEYRYAGTDPEAIKKHIAELIPLAPDVILANSSPVTALLRPATNTIPIVFVVVNDPVVKGSFQILRTQAETSQDSHSSISNCDLPDNASFPKL